MTLVNPQISPDLSEPNLTFIHVPRAAPTVPVGICTTARRTWNRSSAISRWNITVILISWWPGWFNGLLTSRTRLFIKGNGIVDLAKLQEMVADVSHHFPLRLPAPTPKALYSLCEIRHGDYRQPRI